MDQHRQDVARVALAVKSFYSQKEKFRIYHGSTNSTRNQSLRDRTKVVDTSRLNHVLQVDTEKCQVITEPNVTMDRLVEATLAHNLIPPVVMDFPGITVGGGYSGTSGESSSFKHGFFDQTLECVEIVLATGEVIACSDTEHPDLFHGAAGALGTLGVVTLLCIRLKKASRFVEVIYHPVTSVHQAVEKCRYLSSGKQAEEIDYLDGILFSKAAGLIITGRQTDQQDLQLPVRRFSDASDPWFYIHVQGVMSDCNSNNPVTELIPLPEYLFRYDRGGFWVGKTTFQYFLGLLPFTQTTRRWFDDFMHTRMLYAAMHAQHANIMILQDVALPFSTALEFINWEAREFNIWPLWLCPLRQSQLSTMHPHAAEYEMHAEILQPLLNVGLWGSMVLTYDEWISVNRKLEAKLRELRGMKWLYGNNLQPEDEFWLQFERAWYDELRKKYHASHLPSVYEKAWADVEKQRKVLQSKGWIGLFKTAWPVGGIECLRKAWYTGVWKEDRKATWTNWVPRR